MTAVKVYEFERHEVRHFRITWQENGEVCCMNLRQGGIMGKDEAVALIERRLKGKGELVPPYRPHMHYDGDDRDQT